MSKVLDDEIVMIKEATYSLDIVFCSQWKRDGTEVETISMNGASFLRFGMPVF